MEPEVGVPHVTRVRENSWPGYATVHVTLPKVALQGPAQSAGDPALPRLPISSQPQRPGNWTDYLRTSCLNPAASPFASYPYPSLLFERLSSLAPHPCQHYRTVFFLFYCLFIHSLSTPPTRPHALDPPPERPAPPRDKRASRSIDLRTTYTILPTT